MANAAITCDPAELLDDLAALPAGQQLARLQSMGAVESRLDDLCQEAERLATTEIGQGLAASELVVALADQLGVARLSAESRRVRAAVLAYAGRYDDALIVAEAAAVIAETSGLVVAAARARLASVHSYAQLARYNEAVAVGMAARAACETAGEMSFAARADVCLGAVFDMRDDHVRALEHYDRALLILEHDSDIAAQIQSNRGIALMGLDDFSAAETAFRDAVTAFTAGGVHWGAAIAEGNLAYLATRQGRLERALHHFERARRFLENDESPADLARLLAEQADALASLGMPAEALHIYERVLPDLETHGLALEAAQGRAGLGRVCMQLGRLDEAGAALAAAAAALETLDQHVARARVNLIRAELLAALGQPDAARLLAEDALATLGARPSDVIVARERLARLDLAAGDGSAAEAHIAIALPIAERLDLAPLRARLLHTRGLAKADRGAASEALADFRAAVDQVERLRGVLQAERLRTAYLGSHLGIYEDAVQSALDSDDVPLAETFALVERAKSRALLDVVGGALDLADASRRDTPDPAEAALLAELTLLQSELNWQYSRLGEVEEDLVSFPRRAERRATMQRLESDLSALEDRLAAARGLAALYAPPVGLNDALALVPSGVALIEYFAAGNEMIAFVLRDGQASVARHLATPDDLAERVSRVHFQIGRAVASVALEPSPARSERLLTDVQRELGDLYDLLIRPLGDAIAGAARLLIVPQGALHTLPFQALWDGAEYLIETREIVFAPSASVLARLTADRRPDVSNADALVVGVPDALAPWIELEATRVARTLGVRPILGKEATVERLTGVFEQASVIHLACHGRFSADRPLASGVQLADRWLTVRDVYALTLRASLVTLSGCDTGRAAVSGGDELLGLMRGFFAAGAASLLISLWVVNDESTTELMTDFYGAYRRGVSPAFALRSAQCALLARKPHPAFWAPFILEGHA